MLLKRHNTEGIIINFVIVINIVLLLLLLISPGAPITIFIPLSERSLDYFPKCLRDFIPMVTKVRKIKTDFKILLYFYNSVSYAKNRMGSINNLHLK